MIFKDKFLKNNILMFLSTSIANFVNLLYQLLIVRKLSVANYGIFNSLLSVFVIISLPLASLATMITKYASSYNNTGERTKADFFLFVLLRHMFVLGIFFAAIYLIFGFYFKTYLHLDSIFPVYLTGGMLFLTIMVTVTLGGLQGFERFGWFSTSAVANGLSKLLLAFLFLSLGWDLLGALGAYLASQIIALSINLFSLREVFSLKGTVPDINLKEKYRFAIPSLITLGCMALLTNIDVVFVKHFFSPIDTGYYSVAQLIGKMVLFIPNAVYIVILPRASGLSARRQDPTGVLKKGLKYTAFLCLSVIVVYNIFPQIILTILTGKTDTNIIFLGRLFSVTMAFFSLVFVLLLYQLSISKFKFLKPLILFSLLQILAILVFHISLAQVLFILLINSIILLILNLKSAMQEH